MCWIRLFILWSLLGNGFFPFLAAAQLHFDQRQRLPEVQTELLETSVIFPTNNTVTFRIVVEIPPDHHGYLDQGDDGLLIPLSFTFPDLAERDVHVSILSHPPGVRDEQAQAMVLRNRGEFSFQFTTPQVSLLSKGPFSAILRYQICNDLTNICYPPRERDIPLPLAAFAKQGSVSGTVVPTLSSASFREYVTALFQRHMRHSFLAFILVFIAGILASATPCVYPILPITSAILLARGGHSRQRVWFHALAYFVGIIFFYALLGFLAATTGMALSTIMTSSWVNLGFAGIFAYFGLSMIGLYEFQFLPLLTAKLDLASSRHSGLSGTFFMGTTAGLVASPCVGPVVGAILLEITGRIGASSGGAATTTGGIFRGVGLMTGFGIGLGIPFLLLGILSHWTPRSGPWLTRVKCILGLPILYFSYIYYLKGLETASVSTNVAHAMLFGAIAIGLAVFIGGLQQIGETRQPGLLVRQTLGIILLIAGIYFLYNGLGQSGILLTAAPRNLERIAASVSSPSPSDIRDTNPAVEVHGNLQWLRDFYSAKTRAALENKPLFVDFYAAWCANCKAFSRLTLVDPHLNTALQQVVLVKLYDTDAIFRTFQQDQQFPELGGLGGYPFLPLFAIYSSQGTLLWKGQDYGAVQTMVAQLEQAKYTAR